jgi:hypothetical protein
VFVTVPRTTIFHLRDFEDHGSGRPVEGVLDARHDLRGGAADVAPVVVWPDTGGDHAVEDGLDGVRLVVAVGEPVRAGEPEEFDICAPQLEKAVGLLPVLRKVGDVRLDRFVLAVRR